MPRMNFHERHYLESELDDFHRLLLEALHSENATDYILTAIELAKDRQLVCDDNNCKLCRQK